MIIFRTHPEHIDRVVERSMHALTKAPRLSSGDVILISQTIAQTTDDRPPIRYIMEFDVIRSDPTGELSKQIWGKAWPYLVYGRNCRRLKQPFNMGTIQVSSQNYGQGGPFVHVAPEDEAVVYKLGLLD